MGTPFIFENLFLPFGFPHLNFFFRFPPFWNFQNFGSPLLKVVEHTMLNLGLSASPTAFIESWVHFKWLWSTSKVYLLFVANHFWIANILTLLNLRSKKKLCQFYLAPSPVSISGINSILRYRIYQIENAIKYQIENACKSPCVHMQSNVDWKMNNHER